MLQAHHTYICTAYLYTCEVLGMEARCYNMTPTSTVCAHKPDNPGHRAQCVCVRVCVRVHIFRIPHRISRSLLVRTINDNVHVQV